MTTTLTQFRSYLTPLVEGRSVISATTDAAGLTDKTTLVASELIEYYDDFGQGGFFNGWYVYYESQERRVQEFVPETGVLSVYRPFSAQTLTAKAIEIHPYPLSDYNRAINKTLKDMYSEGYYFNPQYNETLWGQRAYGEDPNEFNKSLYTVPVAFKEFPVIYTRESYTGTHDGADAAAALTDSTANWKVNELVGETVHNKTDGSTGTITANTATTVTATLSGGGEWDTNDEYIIPRPGRWPERFTDFQRVGYGDPPFKFYAEIPERCVLILEGRGPLSAFTTDASTTELEDYQAEVAALWAAYRFCEMMAARFGGDREEWNQKSMEWRQKFSWQIHGGMERPQRLKIDRNWL